MLSNSQVTPTLAAKDMDRAKKFYTDVLGLKPTETDEGGVLYEAGAGSKLYLYASGYAGTNKATYVSWDVADLVAEMKELRDRGVVFEEYDMPGLKTVDGVVEMGDFKAAWFKDSEGNIHSLNQNP